MPTNAEAADLLRAIADLLDLTGEKFKPEAYRRAARSLETLPESLEKYRARGQLREIPGVGEAIADKLEEFLAKGHLDYLDRLQKEIPPGVVELMRLPGIGPKTARRLWLEFQVDGPGSLRTAIDAGRLAGAKGFGERKIAQFREASGAKPAGARIPIFEAWPLAQHLLERLRRSLTGEERAELAGSLRRGRETIGDVDLLAGSLRPGPIFDAAAAAPDVAEVVLRGDTKMTLRLKSGLQVDVRVVEPGSFGSALQYFTGSKEHNVRVRSLARDLGLKLNEYGVYRGETSIAGRTEFDVYDAVGLSWIPPEMREDRGEVNLAATDSLPRVVEAADLKGDLHGHPAADASPDDIDRVLAEARRRRLDYVGLVVEGVDEDGARVRLPPETLRRIDERRTRRRPGDALVLRAAEEGVRPSPGPGIVVEYRLLRADAHAAPPNAAPAAGTWGLVHLGMAPSAPADRDRWRRWLEYAARYGLAVEVGPCGERIDSEGARELLGLHGSLLVPTGFERSAEDATGPVALGFARRAWATAAQVRNAAPLKDLERGEPPRSGHDATMRSSARRARAATSGGTSMT